MKQKYNGSSGKVPGKFREFRESSGKVPGKFREFRESSGSSETPIVPGLLLSCWVTFWDKKLLIIPRLWGSMVAAATPAMAVATAAAAATAAATATFVKSKLSLQVLKRLLSLLVF